MIVLPLFEIALVLVRLDHGANGIVNVDHRLRAAAELLLFHDHGRTFRARLEKVLSHSFRQANAAVRRCIPGDIALVHCVAAVEMHAIGHPRSIEMCPGWLRILERINVRFHDVTVIIDVIAELAGDVIPIFGNNVIVTRRSREPGFASRDSRFADHPLAFVKIRSLFAEIDDNLTGPRYIVALPITQGGSLPRERSGP